jgi:hypothetical protein
MNLKVAKLGFVGIAAAAMIVAGCSGADNAGPASQSDVNNLTKTLQKNQDPSLAPVPEENKVPTFGAGPKGKK